MREHDNKSDVECSTLVELLRWRATRQPDRRAYTFLVDGETQEAHLTYAELDRQARAIAALLQNAGAAGQRVLLLYPPGLEFIAAFFGCLYGGVIAVPVYPPDPTRLGQTLPRLYAIANDAQPTMVLTTSPILSMADFMLGEKADLRMPWLTTDNLALNIADEWQDPKVGGDTIALLQYTSGSTADPKGVMLSHQNVLYNEQMIHEAFGTSGESTVISWLPLYHDMGLIGNVLHSLYIGIPCILMSPLDFVRRPLFWLETVSRHKGALSGGPDFAYDLCVRKISPQQRAMLDLSGWQVAFCGAEPVRHRTMERFVAAFEPHGFRREVFKPTYGLAEASLFVGVGPPSTPPIVCDVQSSALEQGRIVTDIEAGDDTRTLVSCGRTWLAETVVIANPQSLARCQPGEVGEVWVSGPHIGQGYWNWPEETARTFRAQVASTGEGPFLRTGDLGFVSKGELFVTGRVKDLIIVDGLNHYPQDIELTVEQSHPVIRRGCSAAFSIDSGEQERVIVVAEVDGRSSLTPQQFPYAAEITRAIVQSVSAQHGLHVHDVVLLEAKSIPKTSSGKIQRHACRAGYLAGTLEVWKST